MVVINYLYEIKLSSDKSNLNYNESATITVQAVDFNGANITGKEITITVDKGNFMNGSTSIGKSYTGTTGANGFTVSYKATEYGIINFNCTIKSSNLQLFANNLKKINITTTHGNSPRPLYVDELRRRCYFSYYYPTGSLSGTKSTDTSVEGAIIPSAYRPLTNIRAVAYRPDITWTLKTDGKIYYRIESTPLSLGAEDYIRFDWYY
jgi:hypothetical protein